MSQHIQEYIIGEFDKLALSLRKEAEKHREYDDRAVSANTLDKCAAEIESLGSMLIEKLDCLSAQEYADENGVTVQTVRRWCRNDEIEHFHDKRGVLIPRHAKRNRESRVD